MKKKQQHKHRKQQRNRGLIRRPPSIPANPNSSQTIASNDPAKPAVVRGGAMQVTQSVTFAGPIPPPELLRAYNEIVPDGANRILTMAEQQSNHRIELESTVIKGDDRRANWGLVTGFTIGIVIIVLSFVLILLNHDVSGTVLGTIDLAGLIGVFVYGRSARQQELKRRDERNKALTRRN